MKPLVSVIIVNWNGGKVFGDCLRSLSKIDYPNWELIVVDNGSTDASQKLPRKFKLPITNYQLIQNKSNVGFASANNQGYKKSKGKYLLLLNNDTKVTKNFLAKLVLRIEEDPCIGVIQPKLYMMDKKGYLDNAGSFLTRIGFLEHWGFGKKDGREFSREREVFSTKGACMLIRRKVIEKVGLFDEDFISYFEESDFCWRVWLAGYRVIFYPDAKIFHKVGFTIRRLDVGEINYHYYKNRINSLIKNLELKNLIPILSLHLTISVGISTAFLFRGLPKSSWMIIKAILWNILHFPQTIKKRRSVQRIRKVKDKELFGPLLRRINWKKFIADFSRVEEDIKR